MITENLSTLKIHQLTQAQYERELEAGRIDENALYLTPYEEIDLSAYATIEQLNEKANVDHIHDGLYYTETEIDDRFDVMQSAIDSKVDTVDGMGLSTNDYTTSEKDKLATIEANANFYEHPVHDSYSSGLYKVTVDGDGHVSGAVLAEKEDIVALGIPAQDTTYEEEISDLSGRIDDVENSINTTNQTLESISQEFESYKTTNNEAVSTNASGIEANKTAIEEIQGDYLTSTNKEQLEDEISKVSEKATANASAIEVLNGVGDGSVKQSIDNAFNEFAANVTNDDVVNTYKELIDYAAKHGPEFTELVGKVDTINTHVGEVETDLSNYKTAVSDQFTEVDTTINNHVTDTNNPHGVTKEQIGLENVDNTSDLEKPISNAVKEALNGKADSEHLHTKDQVGLNNVDNTTDMDKPISYATQAVLDGKANVEHTHEIEDINGIQDSLDGKADSEHEHSANNITSGILDVEHGGTGYDSIVDTTYTTARYRASALRSTETAPTTNGTINWVYE